MTFQRIVSLYGYRKLLTYIAVQKVLGINRHVPWPVHWSSVVKAPEKIDRGTRTPGLSPWVYLDGRNGIIFGKNVWVGPGVKIISMNHDVTHYPDYIAEEPIEIGENCWLGADALIMAGVKLGNHVVVGAGSVVTKSFLEDDVLIAGNPAVVKKKLPPYQMAGQP